MKISKLFHWLYAIIMLLPVAFIGVRCLYVIFNKNAKDSYSGEATYEINYKYQSNEVIYSELNGNWSYVDKDSLIVGNIYEFRNMNEVGIGQFLEGNITFELLNEVTLYWDEIGTDDMDFGGTIVPNVQIMIDENDTMTVYPSQYGTEYLQTTYFEGVTWTCDSIIFKLIQKSQITNIYANLTEQVGIFETDYNEIESVNIDTSGTLDNAFIYSVNEINTQSLFSWAKNSFLVTPISYITVLFGLEAQSPINTMLSYWLAISIIWLVFDLIMYVPLLVHRWLDKGILE